jgi:DNA mismatch endonuclease (patch repair protein)
MNADDLPGAPDIVMGDCRLAVFCDGDFWHGRRWRELRNQLARRFNAEYWIAKISTNRSRDRKTRRLLQEQGWRVMRYWESDIKRDPARVAESIAQYATSTERKPRGRARKKTGVSE